MTPIAVLVALLAALLGAVAGLAWAGQRDSRRRAALGAELAAAQATLTAEREAGAVRLEAERAATAAQLTLVRGEREQLKAEFEQLSAQVVKANSQEFAAHFQELADLRLKASEERAAAELEKERKAVETLVAPLTQSLTEVRTQLHEVEKSREGAYHALRQQVSTMQETSKELRNETRALVSALRAPEQRGKWGEVQLRRVVEAAGLVEHCDFVEQSTVVTDEDARLRPDLVVTLAGGKRVVVDAKVSVNAYLDAVSTTDTARRADRLQAHARHLRKHIDDLHDKAYWQQFEPTPEFVVMFVPAEVMLNAAMDEDPTLFEHAFDNNVVIATPHTLIALLRTIGYAWKQEALADNAREVYRLGKDLHGRLATMGSHLTKLGGQLTGAVKAYNDTVGSLESRVLVTARKLTELKVSDDELASPQPLEVVARQVQAGELVASAQDALVVFEPARPDVVVPDPVELDDRFGVDAGANEASPSTAHRA